MLDTQHTFVNQLWLESCGVMLQKEDVATCHDITLRKSQNIFMSREGNRWWLRLCVIWWWHRVVMTCHVIMMSHLWWATPTCRQDILSHSWIAVIQVEKCHDMITTLRQEDHKIFCPKDAPECIRHVRKVWTDDKKDFWGWQNNMSYHFRWDFS